MLQKVKNNNKTYMVHILIKNYCVLFYSFTFPVRSYLKATHTYTYTCNVTISFNLLTGWSTNRDGQNPIQFKYMYSLLLQNITGIYD